MQPQTYTETTPDLFLEEPVIYGSFWERFGALFIDSLILMIPAFAIQYFFPETLGSLLSLVMYWLYFAVMESSSSQATIGKKALGLMVTDVAGNQINFLQATGRYFGRIANRSKADF